MHQDSVGLPNGCVDSREKFAVIEFKPDVDVRGEDAVIGCIGAGMITAECHLPAYQETGFKVGAIASRTQANAAGFGQNAYLRLP